MSSSSFSWKQAWSAFADRRVLIMLFLGFSAGIPILLIFSSLSLWLGEAGIERSAVTFFSWAALGYSFKFVWAPLIDEIPLPYLTRKLGRRRAWLLVAQALVISAISIMAFTDPAQGDAALVQMAIGAVLLGFSAATQDIVIDAYRIELAETELQTALSASYNAGYRLGMIVAGAGALFLASSLGTEKGQYLYSAWQTTYLAMAGAMLIGVITTLIIREPVRLQAPRPWKGSDYARLVAVFVCAVSAFVLTFMQVGTWLPTVESPFASFGLECVRMLAGISAAGMIGYGLVKLNVVNREMAVQTWIAPIRDFFARYGWHSALLLLALIGLYRISDIVAGVISNVFYQDMGFNKAEIATAVKTFGVVVSIVGGFVGGLLSQRYSVLKILMLGAILSSATNLIFIQLSYVGHDLFWMYVAITADNLASGLAGAAFVAFLSSLTNVSFTAVQYAIFTSLMTLIPKVLGGYSGTIVDSVGYPIFFTFTTLIGVPVLGLIVLTQRQLARHDVQKLEESEIVRMLHTMLRVGNLEQSIAFYTEVLGMQLLRRQDYPEGRFTLAFVGYGAEDQHTVLELTHNWDTTHYDLGNGYGHIALAVPNAAAACDEIRARGGRVVREAGAMKHGTTVIAFVEDPDGYKIELIERH